MTEHISQEVYEYELVEEERRIAQDDSANKERLMAELSQEHSKTTQALASLQGVSELLKISKEAAERRYVELEVECRTKLDALQAEHQIAIGNLADRTGEIEFKLSLTQHSVNALVDVVGHPNGVFARRLAEIQQEENEAAQAANITSQHVAPDTEEISNDEQFMLLDMPETASIAKDVVTAAIDQFNATVKTSESTITEDDLAIPEPVISLPARKRKGSSLKKSSEEEARTTAGTVPDDDGNEEDDGAGPVEPPAKKSKSIPAKKTMVTRSRSSKTPTTK